MWAGPNGSEHKYITFGTNSCSVDGHMTTTFTTEASRSLTWKPALSVWGVGDLLKGTLAALRQPRSGVGPHLNIVRPGPVERALHRPTAHEVSIDVKRFQPEVKVNVIN